MDTLHLTLNDEKSPVEDEIHATGNNGNDTEVKADSKPSKWTGPRCEKCEAPLKSDTVTICRSCGWYASLGTFVDIDPNWETVDNEDEEQTEANPKESTLQIWIHMVPPWGWIIVASLAVVVAESVVGCFVTEPESRARTIWSVTQLAIGGLVFTACHIIGLLVATIDDAEMGLMDMVIRPLRLWIRIARNLPQRLRLVNFALCAYMAMFMSTSVLGGIPYERLLDWGIKPPPKKNLMGAIINQMKENAPEGDDQSLEEAIDSFAGTPDENKKPKPAPREEMECVILGYRTGKEGRLDMLILGAAHYGKLVYAGRVKPVLEDKELNQLGKQLAEIQTKRPLLKIQTLANWVKPKFTCLVTYGKRGKSGRMIDVEWKELLGEVPF